MKILVCSKRDLTGTLILNDLLPRLSAIPGCRLGVVVAERTRPVETEVPELKQMKFHERDLPFGLLFPHWEKQAQPVPEALLPPGALAARHGCPLTVARAANDPAFIDAVRGFAPDLILSVRFSFLFPPGLIAAPRHGITNVHPGLLPDYAGLYPHFFSMLAGEATLGCTVHHVDAGIDSGPILAEGEIPIDPARSAFTHNLEAHLLGNRLAEDVVARLAAGAPVTAIPQRHSALRSNTYPTPAEFAKFRDAGLSLIDPDEYTQILQRFAGAHEGRVR